MVLHFWLIPLLAIVVIAIVAFFYAMKLKGGSGVRTEGRTVVDKPVEDDVDSVKN
jgi:hypothetical protein